MKASLLLVAGAAACAAAGMVEPIYEDELAGPPGVMRATPMTPVQPRGWVFAEIEADAERAGASEESSEEAKPQAPPAGPLPGTSAYTSPTIPGPYLGSYAGRMDGMGYTVPPYAFHPGQYQNLGPYRALNNMYSDGTPYPMNMQKFDYFYQPGAAGYEGAYAGGHYAGGGYGGVQGGQEGQQHPG